MLFYHGLVPNHVPHLSHPNFRVVMTDMVDYYVWNCYYSTDLLLPLFGELPLVWPAVYLVPSINLFFADRWWRAFLTGGASSLYIFLHALLYWTSKLSLGGFTSNVLYLGYSLLLTFLYFVLTGPYPSPSFLPLQSVHSPQSGK